MFAVLRKIYAMLSPLRQKQFIWLTLGMFCMGFVELGLAGTISLLGVALAAPEGLEKVGPLWKLFQLLPSFGVDIPQSIRMLILVLGLVCVATALKNILTATMTYWQGLVSQYVGWDIGVQVFDAYLDAPYVWHTQHNPADLSVHLTWRAYVASFLLGGLQVASQAGIMLFLMVGAFVMAPLVALLLYGVAASVALLVYKAAQRKALTPLAAHAGVLLPGVGNARCALSMADIMLHTPKTDGLGVVYLEAQLLGVPLVSTNTGGAPEAVVDGESALLVAESSNLADDLTAATLRILRDEAWRKRAALRGAAFVKERFSLENMLDHTLGFYGLPPFAR